MSAAPSGTITFLFTDLEGSTRLWDEHPEAMTQALARHDEVVRGAIESNGGRVVKTTGDGFHAVFERAGDGLAAALAAQQRLLDDPTPGELGPLRVRMGLHTGEVDVRDGDYYGSAVNRAARLMSVAHGGQVVCSSATADLVRDVATFELRDLGEHRLAGLVRPERVWQVCWPGLPSEFPVLRSEQAVRGNLPQQLTSFVGRDAEVVELSGLVRSRSLVTLTGVGGIGKTRLAVEVAAAIASEFVDGAWLCELAPLGDPSAVWDTLAATFRVQPTPGRGIEGAVVGFLAAKRLLLILDNCEHLLDEVARIATAIVRGCPQVVMLATSREGLGVTGEQLVAVRSLTVPSNEATEQDMEAAAAVRLFCDRARSAQHEFGATGSSLRAVGVLCRRLDGIPLAIELAAARSASLTPEDLVDRLDQRFKLLTRGSRAPLERHQTLRSTIDWSYELLSDRERNALQRLSVFAGGADLAAAEAVVPNRNLDRWDVVDVVAQLVAKSLVVAEPDPEGHVRYRLLETIRQYAQERLEAAGHTVNARTTHAQYFVELAERHRLALRGRDQLVAAPRMARETDNFRAVMNWAEDSGDADLALRLVSALAVSGAPIGYPSMAWAETAITIPGAATHRLFPEIASWATFSAAARHDLTLARDYAATIDPAESALGTRSAAARRGPAVLAFLSGDLAETRARAEEWVDLARHTGDPYELANALILLASALMFIGDQESARRSADEALAVARRTGLRSSLAIGSSMVASMLLPDEPEQALRLLDEAVAVGTDAGDLTAVSAALSFKAWFAAYQGQSALALSLAREGSELMTQAGLVLTSGPCLLIAAVALANLGQPEPAAILLSAGRKLSVRGPTWTQQLTDRTQASLIEQLGRTRYDTLDAYGAELTVDEATATLANAAPDSP